MKRFISSLQFVYSGLLQPGQFPRRLGMLAGLLLLLSQVVAACLYSMGTPAQVGSVVWAVVFAVLLFATAVRYRQLALAAAAQLRPVPVSRHVLHQRAANG